MAITKCKGTNCPIKSNCYRYKALENPYCQSYLSEVPWDHDFHCCDYFVERPDVTREED